LHKFLSPGLILGGRNSRSEFIRFDWEKRDENIVKSEEKRLLTEMRMGSEDGLTELCGFGQRRGRSPDEGGEHEVKDELLTTFIWFSLILLLLSLSAFSPSFLFFSRSILSPTPRVCRPKRVDRRP
jgi:hypothetical protein